MAYDVKYPEIDDFILDFDKGQEDRIEKGISDAINKILNDFKNQERFANLPADATNVTLMPIEAFDEGNKYDISLFVTTTTNVLEGHYKILAEKKDGKVLFTVINPDDKFRFHGGASNAYIAIVNNLRSSRNITSIISKINN